MLYPTARDWLDAPRRKVLLFGMSGLGKTHVSAMLRGSGAWFHYSVDYRIGTRYLGEEIADGFKAEAMKVPLLREMLMTDSIWIGVNLTFQNLAPLSAWVGKPGDPARGGLDIAEYRRRQALHRAAEIAALRDTHDFAGRAQRLYGYPHFVCDSSGSICELIDPLAGADDPLVADLAGGLLPVWIRGEAAHTSELIARFDRAPKPMYYNPAFLEAAWDEYRAAHPGAVDPDAFVRWTYARALEARQPRYAALARAGVTVTAEEVAALAGEADFTALIARAIDRKDDA